MGTPAPRCRLERDLLISVRTRLPRPAAALTTCPGGARLPRGTYALLPLEGRPRPPGTWPLSSGPAGGRQTLGPRGPKGGQQTLGPRGPSRWPADTGSARSERLGRCSKARFYWFLPDDLPAVVTLNPSATLRAASYRCRLLKHERGTFLRLSDLQSLLATFYRFPYFCYIYS